MLRLKYLLLLLAALVRGDPVADARSAYEISVSRGRSVPVQSKFCVALGRELEAAEQPLAAYEALTACSAKAAKKRCALHQGDSSDEAAEQCGRLYWEAGRLACLFLDAGPAVRNLRQAAASSEHLASGASEAAARAQYLLAAVFMVRGSMAEAVAAVRAACGAQEVATARCGAAVRASVKAVGLGPCFEFAAQALATVVKGAAKAGWQLAGAGGGAGPGMRHSLHSNLGIQLMRYGADALATANFKAALALDGSHAGLRARMALAYAGIKPSAKGLLRRRAKLEAAVRELEAEAGRRDDLRMQEPTFELGYSASFLASYDGLNDKPLMEQQARAFAAIAPQLGDAAGALGLVAPDPGAAAPRPLPPAGKIRVGFLSTNFRLHSVGKLFVGLVQKLDRSRFEVVVCAGQGAGPRDAAWRAIAKDAEVVELDARRAAAVGELRALSLDVLVFGDIGMDPYTYFLAFARVAPVQASFFGHPTTAGLGTIDYFLTSEFIEPWGWARRKEDEALAAAAAADWRHRATVGIDAGLMVRAQEAERRIAEEEGAQAHYTEQLVRLPALATFYFEAPQAPPAPAPAGAGGWRAHFGLGAGAHVYICPQSVYKLHPAMDEAFVRILRADPAAQLLLLNDKNKLVWERQLRLRLRSALSAAAARSARAGAAGAAGAGAGGVGAQYQGKKESAGAAMKRQVAAQEARVRFLPKMGFKEWVGLLDVAGVMLDTFPFGAYVLCCPRRAARPPLALPQRARSPRRARPPRPSFAPSRSYTSTMEAFSCCGTPTVTIPSAQTKMLTAHAVYREIGVQGLTASTVTEYAEMAVRVASNETLRSELKAQIKERVKPLFRQEEQVREWEQFLVTASKLHAYKAKGSRSESVSGI